MNLFNEAIYQNYLEHTAKGTSWGKHKYLYITETGRYVYPEDVQKGKSAQQFRSRQINDQIRSAHVNGTVRTKEDIRSQQINDQIRSAHQGATSRNNTAKVSGKAMGSKPLSTPLDRNTVTIKKTETTPSTTKTETDSTSTSDKKYKNMTEEMIKTVEKAEKKKEEKDGTGKKKSGGSGKKKGSGGKSSSKSTKTEEQKQMGLSDDDLKKMEINTEATNRDDVLKNIALRVIRGDYGNGTDRKAKLGNYYDEVQKRVNELTKNGNVQREGQNQQTQETQTEQKKEQSQQQAQQPEQKKTESTNTSSSSNTSSKKDYKMEEYKKDDKDFDEKNYKDANRLGNTNFFSYKRNDGKYVILEEDMKWVVDEKPSSKMIKNLEAMDTYLDKARKNNNQWTNEDWVRWASDAINDRRDFSNADPGKNKTTKAYQDRTREWRTNDQIASAHQGSVKKDKHLNIKTRKTVKHYDLEEGLFLMHFGNRNSGRYRRGSGSRPYQHEARNHSWKERRTMSKEDLKEAIERSRMELDLYNNERNNRSQSQKFIENVMTSIGKTVLIGAGSGAVKYVGKRFVMNALNDEDLANAMFPGVNIKKNK